MFKQRRLMFIEEAQLERQWETFPESAKSEVTQHYARLMARASVQRIRALKADREVSDEPND